MQNLIKFGRDVLLAYQSPPPPYFRRAICNPEFPCANTPHENIRQVKNKQIDLIDFILQIWEMMVVGEIRYWKPDHPNHLREIELVFDAGAQILDCRDCMAKIVGVC